MSSPGHTEMIFTEKEQIIPKSEEEVARKKKIRENGILFMPRPMLEDSILLEIRIREVQNQIIRFYEECQEV